MLTVRLTSPPQRPFRHCSYGRESTDNNATQPLFNLLQRELGVNVLNLLLINVALVKIQDEYIWVKVIPLPTVLGEVNSSPGPTKAQADNPAS